MSRRLFWSIVLMLLANGPANADIVTVQGLELVLDPPIGFANPDFSETENVFRWNINLFNSSLDDAFRTTLSGSIFVDGSFDTETGRFTEVRLTSGSRMGIADQSALLVSLFGNLAVTVNDVSMGFSGILDGPGGLQSVDGPVGFPSPAGTWDLSGDGWLLDMGRMDYTADGVLAVFLPPGMLDFEAEPFPFWIEAGTIGQLAANEIGPGEWEIRFLAPIEVEYRFQLIDPDDTLFTLSANVSALGVFVVPEPRPLGLVGLAAGLTVIRCWNRWRRFGFPKR